MTTERKHRVPYVDWSNPYLRDAIKKYPTQHKAALDDIRHKLAGWAAASRKTEAAQTLTPRPLAVVLDIDETILANLHLGTYSAPPGTQGGAAIDFHAADYLGCPRGSRLNPLLPGAKELLETARQLELHVFFLSGRPESVRDETIENLEAVGVVDGILAYSRADLERQGGPLVLCPDAERPAAGESIRPFKESRRKAIEVGYRIIANIGDQVSDLGLRGDVQVYIPTNIFYHIP